MKDNSKVIEEDFKVLCEVPRKYNIYFSVENYEELSFSANKKNIFVIIKLYVNKIYTQKKSRKLLTSFFSKSHTKNITDNSNLTYSERVFIEVNFFQKIYCSPYKEKEFYIFKGNIINKNGKYLMYHPIIVDNIYSEGFKIDPIYYPNNKKNNLMKEKIDLVLKNNTFYPYKDEEWIPCSITSLFQWDSFINSLFFLHRPIWQEGNSIIQIIINTEKKLKNCVNRIALDELVYYYNQHSLLRNYFFCHTPGVYFKEFIDQWKLRDSQEYSLKEILADMSRKKRMFRLLYGEVGSGKTILAFAAALATIDSGNQAVIIAPTQILAEQMYEKFKNQTNNEISCLLSTSRSKIKKNKEILFSETKMIIGTHAACNLNYERLGLIIFDEQHRFGVKQRLMLIEKEQAADILFMSATPIPRTLFMTRHNFMDVSYLETDRSNVKSYLFPMRLVHKVINRIIPWLQEKEKIFWVCAAVNSYKNIAGCVERFETIKKHMKENEFDPQNRLYLIHGKQSEEEKDININSFKNSDTAILVATSIIEVGINIPDSSIIIIENSERFGLSQLHQLRGRVGRGEKDGKCMFLFENNEETSERLNFIATINNGRHLSEFDMKNRGVGDIKGFKQQGKTKWKFLDQAENILEIAKKLHEYNYSKNQCNIIVQLFNSINTEKTLLS